jgi:hypothetical protein
VTYCHLCGLERRPDELYHVKGEIGIETKTACLYCIGDKFVEQKSGRTVTAYLATDELGHWGIAGGHDSTEADARSMASLHCDGNAVEVRAVQVEIPREGKT